MNKLLILMPQPFLQFVQPLVASQLTELEIEAVPVLPDNKADRENAFRTANYVLYTEATLTRPMLESAKGLRLIQKWGTGLDDVDVSAARERGIVVANVPGGNAVSVAEHSFALILGLYKKLCEANESLRRGVWLQEQFMHEGLEELSGKALGLVGFGKIGTAIAQRAAAFEMRVAYFRRNPPPMPQSSLSRFRYQPLDQLAKTSDVLVLAVPLGSETRHLCDQVLLSKMKSSAILINVSRGGVVNETDLYNALAGRKLAGAGLDVFADEPLGSDNPLLQLPNVIVTPHVAGRTRQALQRVTQSCIDNIARVAYGVPA